MSPRKPFRFPTPPLSFGKAESGAAAPLIGLMMLVLVGSMGIAVDVGRSMIVKARLVDALDAAGLAVGARLTTGDYSADAKKFVTANFKALYAGATVTDVIATPNAEKSVITLAATATMPTSFMRLFGAEVVTVKATSEITRASTGLELVMALDNTGSMDDSGSMPGLAKAATSLVNFLMGSADKSDNVFIGLVPFSQAVNIGTSATRKAWVEPSTLLTTTNRGYPTYWTGCVEERLNGLDKTDDPPTLLVTANLFHAYYAPDSWPEEKNNNWIQNNKAKIDYSNRNSQQGPGANCPQTPVTPMTNEKQTVLNDIKKMKAVGGTHINIGAVWAWRMLSPQWRGFWDGDMAKNKLPLAYNTPRMTKAMVLMTDGKNTTYENFYTAYGKLSDKRLGTSDVTTANAALDTRLKAVCEDMKRQNILIYTVAYDNPGADVTSLLQSCATNISYAFTAADEKQLIAKFNLIAGSLSNLRVSK